MVATALPCRDQGTRRWPSTTWGSAVKDVANVFLDNGTQTSVHRGSFTLGVTSRLVVTGLLCWALAGTAYAVLRLTFGDRPVRIHVRWAPTIDDAARLQLEQRYRLARPEPLGDRTFRYALTDLARDTISNLVRDPAVEDTHEIDRTAFRVESSAPRLPYVTPTQGIPVGLEFLSLLGLLGGLASLSLALLKRAAPTLVHRCVLGVRNAFSTLIAQGRRWHGVSAGLLVMLGGALTAVVRFLAIRGFNNDHFVHLTAAQQMLFGDWPTRDFIDIGRPLQIVMSAVAQQLLGQTLFAEAVLVSAAFGMAAAFTAAIVFRLTGSLIVSCGAVAMEVAAFPRTYAYPKVLATAAGLWLIAYFLRKPSLVRQALMAAGVTIAFLFRHDLGLFVGAGGLVASMLAAPTAPWRARWRAGMIFAAFGARHGRPLSRIRALERRTLELRRHSPGTRINLRPGTSGQIPLPSTRFRNPGSSTCSIFFPWWRSVCAPALGRPAETDGTRRSWSRSRWWRWPKTSV